MITTIIDWARKWGVGVCLILWCYVAYVVMAGPAALLLLLSLIGVPASVVEILVGFYAVICIPILAYHFGRAFGLRYDKIPTKESDNKI
jgi:hypothetical protein